jgi:glutamine synthetase
MSYTKGDILKFVLENDVKFIRLAFCDIFGTMKNISIMPDELPRAFDSGISFDASAVKGFMNIEESDLFLRPDPNTLSVLRWRPQQGRVARFFCNIKKPDDSPFEGDGRDILTSVVRKAEELGYNCKLGPECEFYLFNLDDQGNPTKNPHDNAGYCDIAPSDKGENVRREICLTLEEMGIKPESSHHEQGPGQNEIDFKYSDPLTAADNLITFKSVVKTIASRNGLYASFMPKPLAEHSGNGLHVNLSLSKNGDNIFNQKTKYSADADNFIAGVLNRIYEITAFLNPTVNSYERLGSFEAPKYITWSHQNRSQLIRIPAAKGEYARMELRSPDPACNPYFSFALILMAGLEGIEKKTKLSSEINANLYNLSKKDQEKIKTLPQNLLDAINISKQSEFIKSVLPIKTIEKYFLIKQAECDDYKNAIDKSENDYFKFL